MKLPKIWRGARVVRGLGMDADKMDQLEDEKSLDEFDALHDIFIVVDDRALSHGASFGDVHAFRDEKAALRYARACGNGNVDQRVLHVRKGEQTLVVATENDL